MGFDFRIAEPPPRWPSGYRPQYDDAPEYFRVTHKAMHALRAALACTGALDLEARLPSFPPWPPAPMNNVRAMGVELEKAAGTSIEPPSTATEVEALEQWRNKRSAALAATSSDAQKVPAFKFDSNDGWRVAPNEAATIAQALLRTVDERADDLLAAMRDAGSTMEREEALRWLTEFARYNELASQHGGYVVS